MADRLTSRGLALHWGSALALFLLMALSYGWVWPVGVNALVGDSPNLVANPDFSQTDDIGRPVGWAASPAGLGTLDSDSPFAGDTSARLESSGQEVHAYWSHAVSTELEAEGRYLLSGWVRGDGRAVAFLGVDWTGDGGGQGPRTMRGVTGDGWQRVELEFTAPTDASARVVAGGTFTGALWWDDVRLHRIQDLPERIAAHWDQLLREHEAIYTGLVVDARDIGLRRGMTPRVLLEDGQVVYAGMEADPDLVVSRGIVSYARDPSEAVRHTRLQVHEVYPYRRVLQVTATGLWDDGFGSSPIISPQDGRKIHEAVQTYDFLGRFSVVFLVD